MDNFSKINKYRPTIFLDMDGTLYSFKSGSFDKSILKKKVIKNARLFIIKKLKISEIESSNILENINNLYGENISIGLEELYKIPKQEYFDFVWDINAKNIIKYNNDIYNLILRLKKDFNVFIISDAPRVWILKVLKEMKIYNLLKNNIISGDEKYKKSLGNQFVRVLKIYDLLPRNCISIGDQENSDIIPASKLGIRTIFVSKVQSKYADFTTSNINNIYKIIKALNI